MLTHSQHVPDNLNVYVVADCVSHQNKYLRDTATRNQDVLQLSTMSTVLLLFLLLLLLLLLFSLLLLLLLSVMLLLLLLSLS